MNILETITERTKERIRGEKKQIPINEIRKKAEEQSGTMHTVEFAQNQYKRLACYYHKLVELSSGNRKLEEAGQISVIEDKKRLEEFVEAVMKEQTYEQLTLF